MRRKLGVDDYHRGVLEADRAILGRALTLIESNHPEHQRLAQELLTALLPATGGSHRIGISGVPGVGKSSFIEVFGCRLIELGHRVAVLAVDPSSSLSRGAILGDKTRMEKLAVRDEAFIRPSPSGGSLGGVARKTRESILLCEAAGFDIVIVETVGVGQSETAVSEMVDILLVLMLAGAGDELQGIKRGILEVTDILAINKADGDNLHAAERARREAEQAFHLFRPPGMEAWAPRVVCSSARSGRGMDEIRRLILEHRETMKARGLFEEKRKKQALRWMWSMVDEQLRRELRRHPEVASIRKQLEDDVFEGRKTPTSGAMMILEAFGVGLPGRT